MRLTIAIGSPRSPVTDVARRAQISGSLHPGSGRLRQAPRDRGLRHTCSVGRRRLVWILSLSFWTALGLLCGLQIWISMISHGHALWRVLVYQVLIWNAWLVFPPCIGWMARRFVLLPPKAGVVVAHVVAALVIAAIHSAW